ncbi:MAG: DUF6946 family protein [Candidatus Acidiferrales bacterium]
MPSLSPLSWKPLLSQPERHWRAGYSAMTLAQCWESAADGLPPEVAALLQTARDPVFADSRLLLAIPEYCVPLPGGSRATQTDLFALVRGGGGLGVLAIEGKVDEELGPTVAAKELEGAGDRLDYLHELLELQRSDTRSLRYQLLHRTAAALLLAREFAAGAAAMIVHSFSPTRMWYKDFEAFVAALGEHPDPQRLIGVGPRGGTPLFLGWVAGEQRFREPLAVGTDRG